MNQRTRTPAEQARHYARLTTRWAWIATAFVVIAVIATVLSILLP